MAAPTNAAKREESSCQLGAVHTWHIASFRCDATIRRLSGARRTRAASPIGTAWRGNRLRARRNLLKRINLICPVQPHLQKYFPSLLTQIKSISLAVPPHTEGRFAIVTDVGRGMRWTRQPAPQIHFHAVATIPYQWHLGFDFGFSEF
jgi:hypothetical protein